MTRSGSFFMLAAIAVVSCLVLGFFAGESTAMAGLIYDANADFDAGYVAGNNPNGVWTYGWSLTLDSPFVLYTQRFDHYPDVHSWNDPTHNWSNSPLVSKNTGVTLDDGNVSLPSGALLMYAVGPNTTDVSHVVFTAPAGGDYALSAEFIARQSSMYGTVNGGVHILLNGTEIFGDSITFLGDTATHTALLSLASGDTVDFALDYPGGYGPNWTELRATLAAVPEPSSFALFGIGATCFLFFRVLRRAGRKRV